MSFLEEQLDALALESARAAPRAGTGCDGGCGCARCRGGALRGTAGWRGWTAPASLRRIDAARAAGRRGQKVPAALRPFLAAGPQVYRLSRAGMDRDRPLDIGTTRGGNSIAQRIAEHYRQPGRGDPPVHRAIRNLQPGQIMVQAAKLTRAGMHPRRVRTYARWLRDRERPLLYDPEGPTFDDAGAARSP
jgi:hypothetical protein